MGIRKQPDLTIAPSQIWDDGFKGPDEGEGKFDEALQALETAREVIWNQTPLSFRKTIFVAADPAGFGIYGIRENREFKSGELFGHLLGARRIYLWP
jgi:hypothetical protein